MNPACRVSYLYDKLAAADRVVPAEPFFGHVRFRDLTAVDPGELFRPQFKQLVALLISIDPEPDA